MIKRIEVKKMYGVHDHSIEFDSDLNILTGKNGSGKTNLLKLIWYLISGNLERVPEVEFESVRLDADDYSISITNLGEGKNRKVTVNLTTGGEPFAATFQRVTPSSIEDGLDSLNQRVVSVTKSSIFFPTFRRIEGGFSLRTQRHEHVGGSEVGQVSMALSQFADRISVQGHRFITTISTEDIVTTFTHRYAEISRVTNGLHVEMSAKIISEIDAYTKANKQAGKAERGEQTIEQIKQEVTKIRKKQESLLQPFTSLSEMVKTTFQHSGIRLTDSIVLGKSKGAIASEKLSAGEKQMLSFLCYNILYRNSVIFIDEPELSLHIDWQKTLFPLLLSQETNNQFIVATHSPFIIGKFTDKEKPLSRDKGGF